MKTILHICAGWEMSNGVANLARMIMEEQRGAGHEVSSATWSSIRNLRSADEVWIHCAWKPCLWWAAIWGKNIHWVPSASYDRVRLRYHGWKKWLAGPIERFFLRRADVVVATCQAEAEWIRKYEPKVKKIEVTDVKRFFNLNHETHEIHEREGEISLHLLYLGRRHPLKGVVFLEEAVRKVQKLREEGQRTEYKGQRVTRNCQLRIVSNAFGEEKEKVWEWCDVLVLPTLSENFGLVVAEALERGKRVITTDGAPAWEGEVKVEVKVKVKVKEKVKVKGEVDGEDGSRVERVDRVEGHGEIWSGYDGRLIYLKGYRDGTSECRIELLKRAIESLVK